MEPYFRMVLQFISIPTPILIFLHAKHTLKETKTESQAARIVDWPWVLFFRSKLVIKNVCFCLM